tara:strand:- start:853 stop:1722 length:870 start_codon:yes stop_codon:yes gene_type:complete
MALGSFTSFNAGTTIVASQMNANFATVTSWSSEVARLDGAAFTGACTWTNTITVGSDGTGYDVKFFGDSAGHYVLWDQSADELVLTSDSKLSFHDAAGGENIVASADGHLEINAGTTLDITAPTVDVNGVVDVSGNFTATGGTTTLGATNITGIVNVGSDGSGHDVIFHSATGSDYFFWDASEEILKITGTADQNALSVLDGNVYIADTLDVDGTTNLDVVDIDGAVNIAADLTFAGAVSGANSITRIAYSHDGAATVASDQVDTTPTIFVCTSEPTATSNGDIWFDIS